MPAADSLNFGCLPLGLAHGWKLLKAVPQGNPVKWSDVAYDANNTAVRVRREMENLEMENVRASRAASAESRALAGTAR
jgi:predicted homoserine dehydrogenase-like protein